MQSLSELIWEGGRRKTPNKPCVLSRTLAKLTNSSRLEVSGLWAGRWVFYRSETLQKVLLHLSPVRVASVYG